MTGISFVIPTLNAEGPALERCLRSIAAQDLDATAIEVVVADGGSTDGTRDLAERFGARVIDNPLGRAEPGVKLGVREARHAVRVVLAADNGLPDPRWAATIIRTLDESGAWGVFTHVVDGPGDSSFCRYFNLLHADPYNWFVFGSKAANPARFGELYPLIDSGDGWAVFDLLAGPRPLVALAQGFAFKGGIPESSDAEDDIAPLWDLIDHGERLAYIPNGVNHETVAGLGDFVRKYHRRTLAALGAADRPHRLRTPRLSTAQRRRRALWLPYSLSIVAPLAGGLLRALRHRELLWLWHPIGCFALSVAMGTAVVKQRMKRS